MLFGAAASACPAEPPGSTLAVSFWQTPTSDFGDDARLSARTQRLDWRAAPIRVGDVDVSLGASYDYTRFEYADVPSRDRDLHRIQLPVLMQVERGAWLWRVALSPGVATSSNVFKDLFSRGTSDDVFATGAIDATRAVGDTTLSAGVASDRRFGLSHSYPRIAVRGGGDTVSWQLGAPDAWLDWRAGARTTLGIGVAPAGMQWHVVRDDFASGAGTSAYTGGGRSVSTSRCRCTPAARSTGDTGSRPTPVRRSPALSRTRGRSACGSATATSRAGPGTPRPGSDARRRQSAATSNCRAAGSRCSGNRRRARTAASGSRSP